MLSPNRISFRNAVPCGIRTLSSKLQRKARVCALSVAFQLGTHKVNGGVLVISTLRCRGLSVAAAVVLPQQP